MKNLFLKIKQFLEKKFNNTSNINCLLFYISVTDIFKFFIYPIIIEQEQNLYQTILFIALVSLTIRSISLDIYDLKEGDWFWVEEFKLNHNSIIKDENKFIKTIKRINKFGGKLLLFVTFITLEPLIFILLFRKGNHQWNGLRFWFKLLFVLSNLIAAIPLYYGTKLVIIFVIKIISLIF